jgi:Flp pilus assembly protein TadG
VVSERRASGWEPRRRGAVVVMVAVTLPVLMGFVVLAVDVGIMYNTRADLQRAADAAALAATEVLVRTPEDRDPMGAALQEAIRIVELNRVMGDRLILDPARDVVFGRSNYDPVTGSYNFTPSTTDLDAVQVTVRRTADSPNGATPLLFANIWGISSTDIGATAVAALATPRDIAATIDLSGSMRYDSMIQYYQDRPVNTRDVWAALDGPEPRRPYTPAEDDMSEYATDDGPPVGVLSNWGNALVSGVYDAATDPGLWYIPSNGPCTEPAAQASLLARGYTADQANALMSGSAGTWVNRAAVITGLARWQPSSASDKQVDANELTWQSYPASRVDWTWSQYMSWVSGQGLISDLSQFRYRFGPKTLTEFLLQQKPYPNQTKFGQTPQQPLRAVKDAVAQMADILGYMDRLSLETFNSNGYHEMDLNADFESVVERIYSLQAGHNSQQYTNIGEAIETGIAELTSTRGRENVRKILVLMSDGVSNRGPDPLTVAQQAADEGIRIYTVSVGYGADRATMQQIAEITGGREFYAAGSADEYSRQLREIFRNLAVMEGVALIE